MRNILTDSDERFTIYLTKKCRYKGIRMAYSHDTHYEVLCLSLTKPLINKVYYDIEIK